MGGILSYTAQNCDTFDYKAEIRGIQIRRLNDKISELENMISKHGDDLSEKYNELKELNNLLVLGPTTISIVELLSVL